MQCILAVNGGSSSLKCGLYEPATDAAHLRYRFQLGNALGTPSLEITDGQGQELAQLQPDFSQIATSQRHLSALALVLDWIDAELPDVEILAVGHRVVHGGEQFSTPRRVDDALIDSLHQLSPLAPLHQPYNIELIQACRARLPGTAQLACFDTMFHVGQSALERRYAIPARFTADGIQRYGFHGLSYQYIQRQLARQGRGMGHSLICHFGSGASICAVRDGRSVASSMGFTALDGLPMGSRCGSIDPSVLLYLMRHYAMDIDMLEQMLNKQSGWLGVSGVSSDMLELHASDKPEAQEAIEMFCYRAALEIGRLSAAMQGLDRIVFTGGVGENDADIRARILQRLAWLGVALDPRANESGAMLISTPDSSIEVLVIPTHEGAMIAQHCHEMLGQPA
ncbi:acetate/propionate family kinase [Marinobacterium rhizophilum]|uniref:Acetate kinase n=1 Tax=Marinobacterium rhizophilum TaxID=420402 RepID=A0ABY5HHI6_9GAMM|nr:acetate/propionate family kinase [Marinobacterium rhizophilum]UTW11818.1 acetate/propionate family kinase [Marinobacterium rhizophilum]